MYRGNKKVPISTHSHGEKAKVAEWKMHIFVKEKSWNWTLKNRSLEKEVYLKQINQINLLCLAIQFIYKWNHCLCAAMLVRSCCAANYINPPALKPIV